MERNINLAGTQHFADVQRVNRNMVEKALQMRCSAYLHQVKYELLLDTMLDVGKEKKELTYLAEGLHKQVRTVEEQKAIIKKQSAELQEQFRKLQESEERYHRSLQFASIGAWDWNLINDVFFGSDQMARLLGFEAENIEKSHADFISTIHPDDRSLVENAMSNCIEHGEEFSIEHRVIYPNAEVHWLTAHGDVVRDEDGKAIHMLGVAQDITKRYLAQQELESFNNIMMEREERIIELKEEVNRMAAELGRPLPYPPLWDE